VIELVCPECQGPLFSESGNLVCAECLLRFDVHDGFPILVRDYASLDRQIRELQDLKPTWYLDYQQQVSDSPWRHHLAKRRKFVQKVLDRWRASGTASEHRSVLDLGCGDGNTLSWLAPYADDFLALDYSLLRLARARQHQTGAVLALADVFRLPLLDASVDLVFFNHVLEHLDDDSLALQEVHRILRPDGLLLLGIPNEGSWWWQLAYKRDPMSLEQSDHVHFYTTNSIAELLKRNGFVVDRIKRLGWGPPDWGLDSKLRHHKFLDDLFSGVGRVIIPNQASSLYVLARPR
jgi:SAM-dependent methyltransferase